MSVKEKSKSFFDFKCSLCGVEYVSRTEFFVKHNGEEHTLCPQCFKEVQKTTGTCSVCGEKAVHFLSLEGKIIELCPEHGSEVLALLESLKGGPV